MDTAQAEAVSKKLRHQSGQPAAHVRFEDSERAPPQPRPTAAVGETLTHEGDSPRGGNRVGAQSWGDTRQARRGGTDRMPVAP